MLARVIWLLIGVGVVSQVLALVFWGHATYLWVQGIEAAAAAMVLLACGVCFRRHDPRASRWPPLLALGAIAGFGSAKDLCVATASDTPAWLVALLLTSVAWFLISSIMIWRVEGRARTAPESGGRAEAAIQPPPQPGFPAPDSAEKKF